MIVPFLKGFLSWNRVPLTWAIVALNLAIFMSTYQPNSWSSLRYYRDPSSVLLTGKLYYQFQYPEVKTLPDLSPERWALLGSQGARDFKFLRESQQRDYLGDQVAIQFWKKDIADLLRNLDQRTVKIFGLSSESQSRLSWITYQFMHSGWMHLISNMMMLIIFGAALELQIGSLLFGVIYLLGGVAAGLGFFAMSGASTSPLVGASGSLSAIMAFYVFFETKRRIPFFYLFSPFGRFWGFVYLPTFMILPISFVPDLFGYLATPEEVGAGIAYAAHLGGALFGGIMGVQARLIYNLLLSRSKATP